MRKSINLILGCMCVFAISSSMTLAQPPAQKSSSGKAKLKLRVMGVPKKGESTKSKTEQVDAYWQFTYQVGSLKPVFNGKIEAGQQAAYGGGDYGYGGGMGAPGGGYGGEGGYGGGGMGGSGYGSDGSDGKTLVLYAIALDEAGENERQKVRILTQYSTMFEPSGASYDEGGGYGMGMGAGMGPGGGAGMGLGGMMGAGGGEGMGDDMGMGMGAGMGMGGMDGGYGGVPLLGDLQELNEQTKPKSKSLSQTELELVKSIVSQQVWRDTLIDEIKAKSKDEEFIASAEPKLIGLLKEQYQTQLDRQKMEIQRIESKVAKLKSELARREAAADRVIQVQAGRIVLQAQGLLND